jgi:transcriptional regulator of arginine metabolism
VTGAGSSRRERQRAIRDLISREPIESQAEIAARLTELGFAVTQTTVSRDITELGLVKAVRANRHVYVAPEDLAPAGTGAESPAGPAAAGTDPTDARLRRTLADYPVRIGRSGLVLVLTGAPGTASVIAQAIDDSSLREQEGTLAGDNTLIVLFADEARLERFRVRLQALQPAPAREPVATTEVQP